MEIEDNIVLELIYWARRYCDDRSTYSPTRFNWIYEYVIELNPSLKDKDNFDSTLKDKGKYWPYAQDGMFNEKTADYDARPMKPRRKRMAMDTCDRYALHEAYNSRIKDMIRIYTLDLFVELAKERENNTDGILDFCDSWVENHIKPEKFEDD